MGKFAVPDIPWAEIPTFLALKSEKTIGGAATLLSVDRTTVSRRLGAMETRIGRALFDRVEGKFELTQLGRKVAAAAERAQQELVVFDQSHASERHHLGKVRLSLPPHFSHFTAGPLARFQRENPDILLEISATEKLESLARYETDVAVRITARSPSDTKTYNFGPIFHRLYRSKSGPYDLTRYIALVGYEEIEPEISDQLPDAETVMVVDGYILMREYIAQGVGIGLLASSVGESDPRLEPVSDFKIESDLQTWLLCLPEQYRLRRVQTLMHFLRRELSSSRIDGQLA